MELLKCNRCGKEFPVRSLLAESSGKGLVCQNCFGIISKTRSDADMLIQKKFITTEKVKVSGKKKEIKKIREGKEYFCKGCNYKFISSFSPKKCPYCGEDDKLTVLEEVVKEVEEIIRR